MSDCEGGCCFDDWVDNWSRRARTKRTVSRVTESLLDAIEDVGVGNRTILDVGCGIGDLSMRALADGASEAFGIELSPKAVREARRLAAERGLSARASFTVGDGATSPLPHADVVVLNRVFCCYPDIDALLRNTVPAAHVMYAFTTPPSSGLGGVVARALTAFGNRWYRLRDRKFHGFRVYVHDVGRIDAAVRSAGFRRVTSERRRVVWQLGVYVRDPVAAPAT